MSAPVVPQNPHPATPPAHPRGRYLARLSLLALGVVYGDIGTSPLYALQQAFHGQHGIPVTPGNVLGVLSLIFWALILIVTVKYHIVIIRADNKGEGGVLALMAMVQGSRIARGLSPRRIMIVLGIFGAALLYADGALTPAVSVLSAVEGLSIAAPTLQPRVILAITLAILVALFLFQSRGTAGIGAIFGPVMLVWFCTIALLGLNGILKHPAVVGAVLPTHGIRFLAEDPGRGLLVLGAVFLVVTGGEALYADLGHFGHTAIQLAWFTIPLPALMLNYFGQGALLLTNPEAAANPFYLLAPAKLLIPLIPLATAAAIIASQAVISGAFSLTRQAVQLGYIPRMDIEHTSSREIGQIYVPSVNKMLAVLTIALVLYFQTSSNLAAEPPVRVPGTAVFMYGSSDGTPPALVLNLTHNKVLHEKIVFLTVMTEDVPHVGGEQRVTVKRSGKGFHNVLARYGFMQDPDINEILAACKTNGLSIPLEGTTFFLGRETLIASDRPGMAMWRERLFAFMSRNALRATAFFKIPPNQVFEVGAYVEL